MELAHFALQREISIDIKAPTCWQHLSDKQLRFVFMLLNGNMLSANSPRHVFDKLVISLLQNIYSNKEIIFTQIWIIHHLYLNLQNVVLQFAKRKSQIQNLPNYKTRTIKKHLWAVWPQTILNGNIELSSHSG